MQPHRLESDIKPYQFDFSSLLFFLVIGVKFFLWKKCYLRSNNIFHRPAPSPV